MMATLLLLCSTSSSTAASWGYRQRRPIPITHTHHQQQLMYSSSENYNTRQLLTNDSWVSISAEAVARTQSVLHRIRGGGGGGTDESSTHDDDEEKGDQDDISGSGASTSPEPIVDVSVLESNNEHQSIDNQHHTVDDDSDITSVEKVDEATVEEGNNANIEIDVALEEDEGGDDTTINLAQEEDDENVQSEVDEKSYDDEESENQSNVELEAVTTDDNMADSLTSDSNNDDNDNNDDDDSTDETTPSSPPSLDIHEIQSQELRSSASDKRALGKQHHDNGNLNDAAIAFRDAAMLLDEALDVLLPSKSSTKEEEQGSIAVERATCRLHEALCLLKDGRPGDCVEACTEVLGDGVTVVPLDDKTDEKHDDDNADDASDEKESTTSKSTSASSAVVKIIPATTTTASTITIPAQIRARAHHRRAKARLSLGDLDGALEDARSAAFMGDRNAVQFYGRLMREGSGTSSGGGGASSNELSSPMGMGNNPFLDGLLGGNTNNPLMPPSMGAGSSDFSSSLLSSLLTGSSGSSGGGNPFGLMGELFSPPPESKGKSKRRRGRKKKGGMDSLAKSVVSNIMKRIEDEETQERICGYLQSTNKQQIMQLSTMAGVSIKEENAQRLAGLANGITPRGIRKGLRRVKRGLKVVKTARKILKVIDKYKPFIILAVLLYWVRSAILEPYPISKKKKLAEKAALSLLIMPTQKNTIVRDTLTRVIMSAAEDDSASDTVIEEELEYLQHQLTLIEALEERNKAQIESFIDEEDQWNSMDKYEKDLLGSKESITARMEQLTEELVLIFMSQKSKNG